MSSPDTLRFMLQSLLWTSADNSWAFLSHSLADNCQTTSLFPRIGLSCGTSLELSSREGGILFHTIVPPHSLGSQYEVCSLSVAIPVTQRVGVDKMLRWTSCQSNRVDKMS